MSLSDKVGETFGKLKPHSENTTTPNQGVLSVSSETDSKFSFKLEDLKDYVIVIVGFGITLASIFLLIIPQYQQISIVNLKFVSVQDNLNEVKEQANYLRGLVGLKDELESKIAVADQVLPRSEDRVPYTLDQLIQVSEESNVVVESLSLSGITDDEEGATDTLRSVLIQLKITGPLNNIQDFIYSLENARTLVNINSFQLNHESVNIAGETPEDEDITVEQESVTLALRSFLKADSESVSVDLSALANSPNYDALFTKLNSMDYYETTPIEIEFGRDNPFDTPEATPSFEFEIEELPSGIEIPELEVINEEDDSSGIE